MSLLIVLAYIFSINLNADRWRPKTAIFSSMNVSIIQSFRWAVHCRRPDFVITVQREGFVCCPKTSNTKYWVNAAEVPLWFFFKWPFVRKPRNNERSFGYKVPNWSKSAGLRNNYSRHLNRFSTDYGCQLSNHWLS